MRNMATALLFLLSSNLYSQINVNDPYFKVSSITVETIDQAHEKIQYNINQETDAGTQIGDIISVTRQIIAFGKELYKIVEAGKPVINTDYTPISVLPVNTKFGENISATDLSRWKSPKSKKFKVIYKNGYGSEVIVFTYNVNMSAGGQFNGKGAYITNAQIVPEKVSVAWGYTFNATMALVGLTNLGSDNNPIAGATLKLNYSVSTMVKEERNNMTIFISGDGAIEQL